MTALPRRPDTGDQTGSAAGIGAASLGVLVAVGVALLFIGLTGAERNDRVTPAEQDGGPASPGHTEATPRSRARRPLHQRSALRMRAPVTGLSSGPRGVRPDNTNTAKGERNNEVEMRLGSACCPHGYHHLRRSRLGDNALRREQPTVVPG